MTSKTAINHSDGGSDRERLVLFNTSKDEQFNPQKGYKNLLKRLRLKPAVNKDYIEGSKLAHYRVFVSAGPRRKFSTSEFKALKEFVFESGGSVLLLLGEDGTTHTNVNALLEDLGITINADVVVRTQFFKYFHPKECFVSSGVLNRGLMRGAGDENEAPHYGTKPGHFETSKIHFPTSEGVSEVSERVNE